MHVTIQIPDYLIIGDDIFGKGDDLIEVHPFNPEKLDLKPHSFSSACWRGFVAIYELTSDNLLTVDALAINLEKKVIINGKKPLNEPSEWYQPYLSNRFFNRYYEGLALPLDFTGTFRAYQNNSFRDAFQGLHDLIAREHTDPEQSLRQFNDMLAYLKSALIDGKEYDLVDGLNFNYGDPTSMSDTISFAQQIKADLGTFMDQTFSGLVKLEFKEGKLQHLDRFTLNSFYDDFISYREEQREKYDKLTNQ